jgi:hypothetical protein
MFETVCGELLIDPVAVCREIDEFLIQWHAARMRPPEGSSLTAGADG